jgi:hypothetical protein
MKVFALMHLNIPEKRVLEFPPRNETPARVPKPQWDPELRRETLRLEYAGYVRFGYPVDEELLVTH